MSTRTQLSPLGVRLALCRLTPDQPIPAWFQPGAFASVTYTADELSLVVPEQSVPDGVVAERGWRAFRVVGTLDFELTGVLASLASPLADAGISIFALSTYDTDYVLVKAERFQAARDVLGQRFAWVDADADVDMDG